MITQFVALGAAAGLFAACTFRRLPARWLCDFGETPDEMHRNPKVSRKGTAVITLMMATLFPLIYMQGGNTLRTYSLCISLFFVLLCCMADAGYQIIPVQLCVFIALFSVFSVKDFHPAAFLNAFGGALLLGGGFLLLGFLGKAIYKTEALGFGDVYFAAALGLYLTVSTSWMVFVLTIFFAGIFFAILKGAGRLDTQQYAPLGPFIGLAFAAVVSAEDFLLNFTQWYWQLIIHG